MEQNDSHRNSNFYDDPAVHQRLAEFLGGRSLSEPTAIYITGADGNHQRPHPVKAAADLPDFLERGEDIARSLLDSQSVIAHLDIEYANFDSPAECFLQPERTFGLQQPVIDTIEELLLGFGIRPLHLLTGQGHHFIWRIDRRADAITRLTNLIPDGLRSSHVSHNPCYGAIEESGVQAFAGLGLVMEFLALQIKSRASPGTEIPVEITALHVGAKPGTMRELVSIDLSEYGDPLWTRAVRMPFTRYHKPWKNGLARALGIENKIPRLFTIPLHEMDLLTALRVRRNEEATLALARRACVRIPEQSPGMNRLIDTYLRSAARRFHEIYYETRVDSRMSIDAWLCRLPPCARHVIEQPNDLLLKPAGIQLVARCLLALGLPPRQISALVASIFKDRRHAWDQHWEYYSPELRADFYTRLFCCQVATGIDQGIDFNCVSTQEKGFCFAPRGCNLHQLKAGLLNFQQVTAP